VHHVGILYDQFMMHGQRNIKQRTLVSSHRNRGRARGGEDEWATDRHNIISDFLFYFIE